MAISAVTSIPGVSTSPNVARISAGVGASKKQIPLPKGFKVSYNALSYGFYALRLPFYYTEYFLHDIRKDTPTGIVGSILCFFSDIATTLLWFGEIKAIDLGKMTASLGKIPVMGMITKIPLYLVSGVFHGAGNFFFAVDAVIKLAKGNLRSRQEKIAWFDLVSAVSQVALTILLLSGCTALPALIVIGGIAALAATCAFTFRFILPFFNPDEKKSAPTA